MINQYGDFLSSKYGSINYVLYKRLTNEFVMLIVISKIGSIA